jgi:hypothetical protein
MKYYLKNISNHATLTRYLFNELNIMTILSSHVSKFSFPSSRTIKRGYFPVVVDLANSIRQSSDQIIKSLSNEDWQLFTETVVDPGIKMFERKLCVHEAVIHDDEYKFENENTLPENDDNPFKSNKEDLLFGGNEVK